MFIVHAVGHIDHPVRSRDLTELRFEDMRRRRGPHRTIPLLIQTQQRGLLLRPGYRNPKLLISIDPERRLRQVGQHRFDIQVADLFAFYARLVRSLPFRQKLLSTPG
jgi:hypothetical protein